MSILCSRLTAEKSRLNRYWQEEPKYNKSSRSAQCHFLQLKRFIRQVVDYRMDAVIEPLFECLEAQGDNRADLTCCLSLRSDECHDRKGGKEKQQMTTFTIDSENNIAAHAAVPTNMESAQAFATEKELAKLAAEWPGSRLVDVWNSFA